MSQALVPINGHFQITRTGLKINGHPALKDCEGFGYQLSTLDRALQFAIGDFILYLEETFGEQASQIIDPAWGWSEESLRVYRWVAKQVPPAVRQPRLNYNHHKLVARLKGAQQ